ncbi:hypothetical protein UPYG_G00171410 [Umbra pygmaea]|uniref:Sushi domain-containing protein n=1 Tax=Umbra pygmaea TaxID=75934 RepID=A0ABD0WNR8_UMBPY
MLNAGTMFYSPSWTTCLILLFITSGHAECPKPTVDGNVVLTNDALLKNDFPNGSEATFECANGYVKDQGSERITCENGVWSALELTCKKKDCGNPNSIPHLKYTFGPEGTLFGASAKVSCDKGYELLGPSHRRCYATGWSGKPKCEVVTCNYVNIKNGMISKKPDKEFPEYGDVIEYSCNESYTLVGSNSSQCNEIGEYTSLPVCKDLVTTVSTVDPLYTTATVPNEVLLPPPDKREPTMTTGTATLPTTTATLSVTSTTQGRTPPVSEMDHGTSILDINAVTGNSIVWGSVIGTLIVTLLVLLTFYCFLKKKGSYQTGEDQWRKEEYL